MERIMLMATVVGSSTGPTVGERGVMSPLAELFMSASKSSPEMHHYHTAFYHAHHHTAFYHAHYHTAVYHAHFWQHSHNTWGDSPLTSMTG
jgi:hypothetical protein